MRAVLLCPWQVMHNVLSAGTSKELASHQSRAHRLCLEPGSSQSFMSCGTKAHT
jgi:hypothetical protein